jgi:hypothetical protein
MQVRSDCDDRAGTNYIPEPCNFKCGQGWTLPVVGKRYYGALGISCNFASGNFYSSKDNWPMEFIELKKYYPI